jgi:hypothetical protein
MDPLSKAIELRSEFAQTKGGYRVKLWNCLVNAYKVALEMSSDKESYKQLLKEDFWRNDRRKRPKPDDAGKILLNVMVFIFNGRDENSYNRAWKYAKALETPFRDRTPPQHVRGIIEEEGGIEAMLKKASHKTGTEKELPPDPCADDIEIDKVDDIIDDEEEENEPADAYIESTAKKTATRRKKKKQVRATAIQPPERRAEEYELKDDQPTSQSDDQSQNSDHLYVTRKRMPGFQKLREGQKARLTIRMVARGGTLRPKVVAFRALKPEMH